jgi:hypothetical protein
MDTDAEFSVAYYEYAGGGAPGVTATEGE